MDSEASNGIEETVLDILKTSNLEEVSEQKIRRMASEKLGLDLSEPTRKKFVRQVVEKFLAEEQAKREANAADEVKEEEEEEDENDEEEEDGKVKSSGDKEYDDEGDLIVCRVSSYNCCNSAFWNSLYCCSFGYHLFGGMVQEAHCTWFRLSFGHFKLISHPISVCTTTDYTWKKKDLFFFFLLN